MTLTEKAPYLRRARHSVFGGAKGRVLEIGCGSGLSFPYYAAAVTELAATDPNPRALAAADKRRADLPAPLTLLRAEAEALPFAGASFDTVVCTLVLCTVRDPLAALSEIARVLAAGGELRFYEHVRYDTQLLALCQDTITPFWKRFGGCHPNRDIAGLVRRSGFSFSEFEFVKPLPPLPPTLFIRPHVRAVARLDRAG